MSTTRSSVRCAVTSSGDSTGQSHAEANTALLISSASAVQSLRTANAGILRRLFAKLRGGHDSASQSADPVSVSTTPPTSVLAKPEPLSTAPPTSAPPAEDRKSTRLNSSHTVISYAVFCLKKKKKTT